MTTATIPSRTSGQQYTVTLADDCRARCTCRAGQNGKGSWHAAAARPKPWRYGPSSGILASFSAIAACRPMRRRNRTIAHTTCRR